ncbi:hypothetical protein AB6A40_004796 [Gnathostoma spinigerum]|uniref:Peptidase S1 domain-containing protein n=1 Tax=Gnathostoma spinigerum TaxID=75299 RepID=A0ABD6EFR8_9BILA
MSLSDLSVHTCLTGPIGLTTPSCGISQYKPKMEEKDFQISGQRLTGAIETQPHSWPWTVEIVWRTGTHRCGGVLIEPKFVLTAAHCFDKSRDPQLYVVLVGGHAIGTGERHEIKKIAVHELYRVSKLHSNDIALLRIDPPAKLNETVQVVCLPTFPVAVNKMCVVTGWGRLMEDGPHPKALREIHVPILPSLSCSHSASYALRFDDASMFCAGYSEGGIDACQGDSGGPLMCEINGEWVLHGLVSWGQGCGEENHPGVYTKVYSFVGWINLKMLLFN